MITIKKYVPEDKALWNDFVANSKNGTFMLKRDYMDYHSDRFTDFSLLFYEEDELVALLPASLHGTEVRSHGGLTYGGIISGNSMKQHRMLDCFSALREYLKSQKINKLIYKCIPHIYHRQPAEEDLYALFIQDAKLFRRDVSTTINLENPLKMPKGRKAQISRARREGVIINESEDFESFIALENEILSERHNATAVHTAAELKLLKSRFPDQIHLLTAKQDDNLLAATLLFEYDNLIHTQYMASNDVGREIGALDLLIATVIERFGSTKKYLDFGISTEEGGRFLNTGLIAQKEGFGGRATVYDFFELDL